MQTHSEAWFALRVKPRHEKTVSTTLKRKGFDAFLPVLRRDRRYGHRTKEVELPLFDGYVFCKFDPHRQLPVLTTPSVLYVVGNGRSIVPIHEDEIVALQRAVDSRLNVEPHDYLEVGDLVAIRGGALDGITGILVRFKKTRLVLSVTLLRRSVAVEIDDINVTAGARACAHFSAAAG
jgi:transcription antitermination factor NusG